MTVNLGINLKFKCSKRHISCVNFGWLKNGLIILLLWFMLIDTKRLNAE